MTSARTCALRAMVFGVAAFSLFTASVQAAAPDNRTWKAAVPVETHMSNDAQVPQIALDHDGNAVAVWQLAGGVTTHIQASRFTISDKHWSAPPDPLDASTTGASSPQVATDADGNAMAVWAQPDGVRARRCVNGVWGDIKTLQTTNDSGFSPQIAFDANGNAVAVWHQTTGGHDHVWANHYTKTGDQWDGAQRLEAIDTDSSAFAQIAVAANGNALAVWRETTGSHTDIFANYYVLSTHQWVGAQLVEHNDGNASAPQVTLDGSGNGRAIWFEFDADASGGHNRVWSSRYTPSNNQWIEVQQIPVQSTAGNAFEPQVAVDASGNAVAVWRERDTNSITNVITNNIWSSRRLTSATQWEAAVLLEGDDTGDAVSPSITMDANGNALAVWQQQRPDAPVAGIWTARYAPDTSLSTSWGPPELIERDSSGDALSPRVAFNPNGAALAVWSHFDSGPDVQHFSVRADRYGTPDAFGRFAYIPKGTLLETHVIDGATGQMRKVGSFDGGAGTAYRSMGIEPRGQFAFALDTNSIIRSLRIDAATGALTLQKSKTTVSVVHDMILEPLGRFLYVTALGSISSYVIDPNSGQLTSTGRVSFSGVFTGLFDFDPSGRFLYLPVTGAIAIYAIDPTTGALTDTGLRRAAGTDSDSIRISPSGRFAYTVSSAANSVAAYAVDATGDLRPVGSPIVGGLGPSAIAIDANEHFAYVINRIGGTVSAYAINPFSGALSALPGGPVVSGTTPNDIRIDPSGAFLYVAELGSKDVVTFAIDPRSGALTRAPVPVPQGGGGSSDDRFTAILPGATPLTLSSKLAIVSSGPGTAAVDPITGALSPKPGSPFGVSGYRSAAIDPFGPFAYFVGGNFGSQVDSYRMDPTTGALTLVSSGTFNNTTEISMAVSSNGNFLYTADTEDPFCCAPQFGNVIGYQINRTSGAVTALPNNKFSAGGKTTSAVATHPTNPLVFAANRNSDNVTSFQIAADGRLTQTATATVPSGSQPLALAVDPSGHFLYVANWGASTISGYSISPSGALTPVPGSPLAIGVKASLLAVDPLGRFLYTMTNAFTSALGVFRIDAQSGALTPVAGGSPAGVFTLPTLPESLAVNANGRFVYIGSDLANSVMAFAIDPITGVPTQITGSPFPAGGASNSVPAIVLK